MRATAELLHSVKWFGLILSLVMLSSPCTAQSLVASLPGNLAPVNTSPTPCCKNLIVNARTNFAYEIGYSFNLGGNAISIIDLTQNAIVNTVSLPTVMAPEGIRTFFPNSIAVNATTNTIYMPGGVNDSTSDQYVAVMNGNTNQVSLVPLPTVMAPEGIRTFFPNYGLAIDETTNQVFFPGGVNDSTSDQYLATLFPMTNTIALYPLPRGLGSPNTAFFAFGGIDSNSNTNRLYLMGTLSDSYAKSKSACNLALRLELRDMDQTCKHDQHGKHYRLCVDPVPIPVRNS